MKRPDVNGLVLAGGRSTRMGYDKALLTFHGMPQREFLFSLLSRHCSKVFTSCRPEQKTPPQLNPLYDSLTIEGPLNGILSALGHQNKAWLAVAVDMPLVDDEAIAALMSARDHATVATCFYNPRTRSPEPLPALWQPTALPALRSFVKNGGISPRTFLETHPVTMIDPPDAKIFLNINYPDGSSGYLS